MGSKGSSPQTTQTQQQYTPNPYVAGGGQQAIQGAEFAAGLPFQMPVAPLAPFSPFQNQAFQGIQQSVGMAQPYFGAGAGYLAGSAAPITGQDVAGYYNPMAQNVFAQMGNIFGQQQRDITGKLTQAAGGVGADRIAVGQSELANQQGLAAGQTAAGLYQQALQAAQQQKQMMAGAGYGIAQMGPAAQASQLQGLQAQLGAGGMQQGLAQQYLNSLYQNRLAQIGYPFQTAQYLAGITGGLAPAMGGTSQGQQQTWAAQPSPLAQGLGIGTSLLGLGMAPFTGGASLGMMGLGGGMKGMSAGTMGGTGLGGYGGFYKRGGKVRFEPAHMKGGGTPPPLPPPPKPVYDPKAIGQSGAASGSIPPGGISTEQALAEADPYFAWYGGVPAVNQAQIASMTTPAQRPTPMQAPIQQQASGWSNPLETRNRSPDLFQAWMQRMRQQDSAEAQTAADGGAVDDKQSSGPVPYIQLPMGAGHSGMYPGQGVDFGRTQAPSTQPGISGSISKAIDTLGQMGQQEPGPMDIEPEAMGGAVSPMDVGRPFQEGGTAEGESWEPPIDVPFESAGARPADPHFTMSDLASRAADYYGGFLPEQSQESPANVYKVAQSLGVPQPFAAKQAAPTAAPAAPMATDVGDIPYETPSAGPEDVTAPMPQERPMAAPGLPGSQLERAAGVTKRQESGDYGHVETTLNRRGQPQRALGAYGIMEQNVGPWTQELYGEPVSTEEFLRNPAIQDAVYRNKMGQYIKQYGVEGAGRAWLGGEGNIQNPMAADPYGTRVGDYGRRFAAAVEGGEELPSRAMPTAYGRQPPVAPMGQVPMPYPDALQRDWGQRLTRSPWMALVKAGAAMATTPGPIGSVIGHGIAAGAGELEGQRKELRSEEQINQKAQALYQQAQIHLDRYNRMTPYQSEEVRLREQALAQTRYAPVNLEVTDEKGQPKVIAARFNPRSGQYEDASTGQPVSGRLIARQTGAESATSTATEAFRAARDDPNYSTDQLGTINKWRQKAGLPPRGNGTKIPTQADIDYVKAHPETIERFRSTFGIDPP